MKENSVNNFLELLTLCFATVMSMTDIDGVGGSDEPIRIRLTVVYMRAWEALGLGLACRETRSAG